jgi:hypothetical protein
LLDNTTDAREFGGDSGKLYSGECCGATLSGIHLGRTIAHFNPGGHMSFGLYLTGYILLIIGLAWAASMAGVSGQWIAVGVVAMLGLGIMMGVSRTRQRDPNPPA